MKYLFYLILVLSSQLCIGQSVDCNAFATQFDTYINFVKKPLYLPRRDSAVLINTNNIRNYLNPKFGANNFYLDEQHTAWAGNWFSCDGGGIGRRWQRVQNLPYVDSVELSQQTNGEQWNSVIRMSGDEIAKLSPVEKYDIYKGDVFFSASNYELKLRGPYRREAENDKAYCGFCNGARYAGAMLPEPLKAISVKSKSVRAGDTGLNVIFYPADLKALAAASCFYLENENVVNFGLNYDSGFSQTNQCNINPAVLDIMLRHYLADNKIAFFADIHNTVQIWNETIVGYDRSITITANSNSSIEADFVAKVSLNMFCQDEAPIASINQPTTSIMADKRKATQLGWVKKRHYEYYLHLDKNKQIIDGSWISAPVDFVWLGVGEGAYHKFYYKNEDPKTYGFNGNKLLLYKDVIELIQMASK